MDRRFYRGDIFYADLGDSIGSRQGGIRPVIIIQNDIGNKFSPTVIIAPITSKVHKAAKLPTHVILDYKSIGLKSESFVMLEQVKTINKTELLGFIGRLNMEDMIKVNEATMTSLGLEINEKVRDIENIDDVLVMAGNTKVNNNDFLNSLYKEREIKIQLLKNICEKVGADYREYYNPYRKINSYKKVG